jgi:UDP-2,3-diacylglucosamine pyrophosphatase LpxH
VTIYIVSDLHLDEDDGSRLFQDDVQGKPLAALCRRVADEEAELVLLGDTFDLTSMIPPARGLARFAKAMDVRLRTAPPRDLPALLSAIRRSNPRGMEALAIAAERGHVTLVPGNHDHHLAERRAVEALPAAGLSRARIEISPVRRLASRTVVLQHGHAYDPSNARPGSEGEILTGVMHQAVIPYLLAHGARPHVRMETNRLVALRPEESVIPVLQRWLAPRPFRRLFLALVRLLADNGAIAPPLAWIRRALTADVVRRRVREEEALWQRSGRTAIKALEGKRRLAHGAPRPDVLVLGHTHVLDWAVLDAKRHRPERLYVNLGTWSERCYDAASPPDGSLPALRLADEGGRLDVTLWDSRTGKELQRFEGTGEDPAPHGK